VISSSNYNFYFSLSSRDFKKFLFNVFYPEFCPVVSELCSFVTEFCCAVVAECCFLTSKLGEKPFLILKKKKKKKKKKK
jgi:hypothetical protein